MADVKLNTLPQSTSPTSTQDLLLFDESTNAGQRINYNTLADAILAKLTSKTYTVGGGTQTLISAIDALNSNLNLNYTSSADNVADVIRGWINVAVAKGKSGFYSGNIIWSGHFSGLVIANVHVVSPARVTFLCVPQVGNYSGKHLTATLDGSSFQIYEFEGNRIL